MATKSGKAFATISAGILSVSLVSQFTLTAVSAEQVASSNSTHAKSAHRANYYPNSEELGTDEMRVIALGTGTPNFRKSQASASWLVELGNDEKFLFDIGTGSLANLAALEIPYSYLDKILSVICTSTI